MTDVTRTYQLMSLNNAWANATFYKALADLEGGAFVAERPGFFGSLCHTMNHIHQVDLFYMDALEAGGQGRAVYEREDLSDPRLLGAAQAEADMRLAKFCHSLTADTLNQKRPTERKDGPVEERIDGLLLHLFQHQIHHRGQAHVQLQHSGITPPQLDEFYLQYERAPSAKAYWS